jgi:hypothetical protein
MQAHNLTLGWWGFVSFVGTIKFLVDNRSALMRGTASLRRPHPIDPRKDVALAGRPVFARPVVLLVLAMLVTVVFGLATGGFGTERADWAVGACVDYTDTSVIAIPCDDERAAEGMVLAIIEDVFGCPPGSQYFVEVDRDSIGCLGLPG